MNLEQQLAIRRGAQAWNEWRHANPGVGVNLNGLNLSGAQLAGADLSGTSLGSANLSGANLSEANLRGAHLPKANLGGANLVRVDGYGVRLAGANLVGADLRGAKFFRADLSRASLGEANLAGAALIETNLREANFSGANIRRANLSNANLNRAELTDCDLTGSWVHGINVWGPVGLPRAQNELVITPIGQPQVTVDDLEVAQFMYLMLSNEKVRKVIDTVTSKVVLILGRFTDERKAVLDALRTELRVRNLSPVLFDFEPSANQDITDTVTLLARMARFVIADITDPRGVQQELTLIAPAVMVAIRPIILAGQEPWSMFPDLQRRSPGLLPVHSYRDLDDLLQGVAEYVINPAESKRRELLPAITVEAT